MDESTSAPLLQPDKVSPPERREFISKRFVILTSCAIVLVYLGYGAAVLFLGNLPASANFGDSFGAISGLLNGAGLIAAVVTLFLQHNELQETKKEVHATLEAQKQQAAEATRSADAHERSVNATHLLANVQGLSALLGYYDSARAADLTLMDSLHRELRDAKATATPANFGRRNEIERELREIDKRLATFNTAALGYEKDLSAILRESGYQGLRRSTGP